MSTYNLLIATPDSTLYHADVKAAIFFGISGFFEVLANHVPLIAMVKGGQVEVTDVNDRKHCVEVGEGFLEFRNNKGVLLVSLSQSK